MVLRPYGYAIWENIQKLLDDKFKATGHENVMMPLFIPESLLEKEKDHVEGFAPEVAWVTHGGRREAGERLCVRPTSETLFCEHYRDIIQSYRDLPKLYNQWCSVVRWEKTTRPFLRTTEFFWQEGHTMHETAEEADGRNRAHAGTFTPISASSRLAIPVLKGRKTDKEKFAGAEITYYNRSHDARRQGPAERNQPLFRGRFCPRVRYPVHRAGQHPAVSPSDLVGDVHPDYRRHHHDPRGRQRPGAAPDVAPIQIVVVR
jgi:hypothetical protein